MPQLSYSIGPGVGTAGMLYGNNRSNATIVTAIAGAIIPPGAMCELILSSGQYVAVPLQDTGTAGSFLPKLVGVAVLDSVMAEQGYQAYTVPNTGAGSTFAGYPVGMPVGFLQSGLIWTAWDGNTGTALPLPKGAMQFWHSSNGTHLQGVATTLAASSTTGAEIDTLPTGQAVFYDPRQVSATYTDPWGVSRSAVVMSVNILGHV